MNTSPLTDTQISADPPFYVSAFANDHASHCDAFTESTWPDFVEELRTMGHVRTADKRSDLVGLFSFYRLKPGTSRANKNVEAVSGWVLDLDNATEEQIAETCTRLAEAGLAHVIYSTHGHTDSKWKLRILGPLAAPVAGKDWPPVWRTIIDAFAPRTSDEQCKDVSRMYYFPSCPPGADPIFEAYDGTGLDVTTLNVKPNASASEASAKVDLNAPELFDSGVKVDRCPIGRKAFRHGEHLAKTMPEAISGKSGSVALLRVARALRWGLELDETQCTGLLEEFYNPRCAPAWTDAEIKHKLEAAGAESGAPYKRGALLVGALEQIEPNLTGETLEEMERQHRTDTGNAERFALLFGADVRYCAKRKKWLLWTGARWEWDERAQIVELAKRAAKAMWPAISDKDNSDEAQAEKRKSAAKNAAYVESRQGMTNMLALAQSQCAVLTSDLDADPFLFNVQNGTLDLRTGKLQPHNREDLITKIAPVAFNPDARSSLWTECLEKFTGGDDELAAYLQRAIGYALIGQVSEKRFWFAYGDPDGGKSTFLLAIAGAFGDYHTSTDADTWVKRQVVGGNRGDVVRLLGTRLVTCSEIQKGAKFDSKLIKQVTGGDALTAAAKYEGDISFVPTFALWFAANDAPTIYDDDSGMWNRVRRVPFTHSIPAAQQDRTVQERIKQPEHSAAVLAWAVRGCALWQAEGLGSCAAIERSTTSYRQEMDRLAPFFEECCEFGPLKEISAGGLRMAYESWCASQRARAIGSKEFAAKLRERGCTEAQVGKDRVRSWVGVGRVMPG